MEYDLINNLSNAIDNVYTYTSEDGARKTIAKLSDNCLTITYVSILNSAREIDLHPQMQNFKKESNEMISSRLRTIKQEFKKSAKRDLVTKKTGEKENIETLTVSPYSPFRKLKVSCTYLYEVK